MTKITLAFGGVLIAAGVIAYIASAAASLTALIPSAVGVLLVICGLLARKENLHRHAIHAALAIALLGALGSLMNVAQLPDLFGGTAERPLAVIVSTLMFLLLVIYVILGVRSFIQARRWRARDNA